MKNPSLPLFVACVLASIALPAHAGLIIETVDHSLATGKEDVRQTMQIQTGEARIEMNGRSKAVTIFKNQAMHILNAQDKTYMVMDAATMERSAGAMQAAMEQARQRMANLPPEQRAMMEKMMQQRGLSMPGTPAATHTYDAQATGASDTVSGHKCKVWDIKRDGAKWQQVCVVPFASLPATGEYRQLVEQMRPFMEKLQHSFGRAMTDNPMQQETALATKLKGVPFRTRRYRDGKLDDNEVIVKSWREASVPSSQFEIPSDYRKQEMPIPGQMPRSHP